MFLIDFLEEKKAKQKGFKIIAGVDEAGRGPLAGPVVAAAMVVFDIESFTDYLKELKVKDSKLMTERQREKAFDLLALSKGVCWSVGLADEKEIDSFNILEASKLAMFRAVANLVKQPDFLLLDGNFTLENMGINQKAIVGGDGKVVSIALASVVAKVCRDRLMLEYHEKYPEYGFDKHKGYGTAFHLKKLREIGPCPIHRLSFRPVETIAKLKKS